LKKRPHIVALAAADATFGLTTACLQGRARAMPGGACSWNRGVGEGGKRWREKDWGVKAGYHGSRWTAMLLLQTKTALSSCEGQPRCNSGVKDARNGETGASSTPRINAATLWAFFQWHACFVFGAGWPPPCSRLPPRARTRLAAARVFFENPVFLKAFSRKSESGFQLFLQSSSCCAVQVSVRLLCQASPSTLRSCRQLHACCDRHRQNLASWMVKAACAPRVVARMWMLPPLWPSFRTTIAGLLAIGRIVCSASPRRAQHARPAWVADPRQQRPLRWHSPTFRTMFWTGAALAAEPLALLKC
jgi:hypothetical protein